MFRRVWATERKDLPLKDVAAVGGWRDASTLLKYQQPDEATMRQVAEFHKPPERRPSADQAVSNSLSYLTHPPQIGEARYQIIRHRASSCPSWARTRTLLIQSCTPGEAGYN
jgi:hypothetical protein